jgi:hypothetical protein
MDAQFTVDHMFLRSLTELFNKDCSIFITEGYLEKHLLEKYLFHRCYLCSYYQKLPHHDRELSFICDTCQNKNHCMRELERDLTGKLAIVTGARIKIGYRTSLKLLRCNATVVATTRFVEDARERYSKEPDYDTFKDRLILYGLNLKDSRNIQEFIQFIQTKFQHLDILINNAAQTVRRPLPYYRRLIEKEGTSLTKSITLTDESSTALVLNKNTLSKINLDTIADPIVKSQILSMNAMHNNLCEEDEMDDKFFPENEMDRFGEPLDTRPTNTWTTTIEKTNTVELLEVQLINQIAPTMLVSQLFPLMIQRVTIWKNHLIP